MRRALRSLCFLRDDHGSMNCDFVPTDGLHRTGRRLIRCTRCGYVGRLPRSGNPADNSKPCNAWPRWYEFGYWVELELQMLGITASPLSKCNCEGRKAWLNTFGGKLSQRTDRFGKWLCRLLVRTSAKPPSTPSASDYPTG